MNASKIVLALVLASSSLVFACSGSDDDGKTTDSSGTQGSRGSRSGSSSGGASSSSGSSGQEESTSQTEESCSGSSVCLNGSCKCESGPQKGKSCCYAPEEEDDPPCAKANECDTVCNSCN